MIIRAADDAEIPLIRVLVNQAYQELADRGLNYTGTYQDEETTRERIREGRAFVLVFEGEIAGTVLLSAKNHFTQRRTAYVSQLAVRPSLKRKGLGAALMSWCEELALKEGYEGVQLDTAKPADHLVKWYLKRGYQIVGEVHWDGKTYDSWIFERSFRS